MSISPLEGEMAGRPEGGITEFGETELEYPFSPFDGEKVPAGG